MNGSMVCCEVCVKCSRNGVAMSKMFVKAELKCCIRAVIDSRQVLG